MGFRHFGDPLQEFGQPFAVPNADESNYYLLYDKFITARAAGAVNGTPAEPTGQTRTVIDTNSKLSVTGGVNGVASIATGGVGAGDPGLWYPSQARINGRFFMGTGVINGFSLEFGWDAQQGGSIALCLRPTTSGGFIVRDNGTQIVVGVNIVAGTPYQFAVSLRAQGEYFLVKGGIYTNWTLMWISIIGTSSLFPGFTETTGTDVNTVSLARIPANLYIIATLAYDTFTRANGTLGSTETISPDGVPIAALVWNFITGTWAIVTNKAVGTPTLGADVIVNGGFGADTDWTKGANWAIAAGLATATLASSNLSQTVAPMTVGRWYTLVYTVSAFAAGTIQAVLGGISFPTHAANATYTETGRAGTTAFLFTGAGFTGSLDNVSAKLLTTAELFASVLLATADVVAEVAVTLSAALGGIQAGLVLNLDSTSSPTNFILCYLDGRGNCVLEECVAGVYTNKFTTAITYSAGAILRVIRDGTSCRVFYNNAAVSTVQTMTANVNKNHGLFSTSALNSLDAFAVWARGTSGEYETLSNF